MEKEISSALLEKQLIREHGSVLNGSFAFHGFASALIDSVVRMRTCGMEDKYIVDHVLARVDERSRGV